MNDSPEKRARVVLVSQLRAEGDLIADGASEVAVDEWPVLFSQAANEIEALAKIAEAEEDAFYARLRRTLMSTLHAFVVNETPREPRFTWKPHSGPGLVLEVDTGASLDPGPLKIRLGIEVTRKPLMGGD